MPTVHEIVIAHDKYVSSTVAAYKARLEELVTAATARTIAELTRRLATDKNGAILKNAANARVLRSVDAIFASELEDAGYSALNRAYANHFAGQLPFLDQVLDQLSDAMKVPLPDVRDVLRTEDKRALAAQQTSAAESLSTVVDVVAAGAKRQALFGFAGFSIADLSETLAKAFAKTVAQAETIADTAQVMFYRTATDRAFDAIEKDLPQMPIRYEYEGPDDKLTRAFCDRLMVAAKTYTRDEIGRMNNHQLPNVMVTCGGWNCRHQWMIAV